MVRRFSLLVPLFGERLHFPRMSALSISLGRLPVCFLTQQVQPSATPQADQ
jgi:hypothetical protein